MNPILTITTCEYCGKQIVLESPPPRERYAQAEIHISDGIMLFPERVVEKNHREGYIDCHGTDLSGYYCGPECLKGHIEKLLK